MKTFKNTVYFVVAIFLYVVASTLEYNDLVHIKTQTQGAN